MGSFQGFGPQTPIFFRELAANNTKDWFDQNRQTYQEEVLEPARALVVDLGDKLRRFAPGIHAEPLVNKSLFRINRDTRFSKDKRPYKNHLGLWLWEGDGKRMDRPGFYFQLDPHEIMLGAGMYCFNREMLAAFRQAAVDPKLGPALRRAVNQVKKNGKYQIGVQHYKRVPRGFDPEHKNAELLKYNGLTAHTTRPLPKELYSAGLVDYCAAVYKDMLPIHRWLLKMIEKYAD